MQKEANGALRQGLTQKLGQQHEVIVVNPYRGAGISLLGNGSLKDLVYFFVTLPIRRVILCKRLKVMKQWPNSVVSITRVELIYLRLGQENGITAEGFELATNGSFVSRCKIV